MDQTDLDIYALNRLLETDRRKSVWVRARYSAVAYNIKQLKEGEYPEAGKKLREVLRSAKYLAPRSVLVRDYVRVSVFRTYELPYDTVNEGMCFKNSNGLREVVVQFYLSKQEELSIF